MPHAATITLLLAPLAIGGSAVVLLIACLNDLAARTLPNWASLALVAIGLMLRVADGTLVGSLAVAAAVFALGFVCWRRGWLGGGDVKLMAACTMLVPPGQVFAQMLAIAIAGGVLAAIYLLLRRLDLRRPQGGLLMRPGNLAARIWRIECWRITRRGSLPYGCAIAAGALFMMAAPLV